MNTARTSSFATWRARFWEHPEIALEERFACRLLADELEAAGFALERNIGQMPTVFVASWGSGSPIIGVLAEYDALPGLSQQLSSTRKPIVTGGPGHGSADLCLIASTPLPEVVEHLRRCGIPLAEGPVQRTGAAGTLLSVYIRDPDQNLIKIANYVE